MSQCDAFRFSAGFKMYAPEGVQVYFHIGKDEQTEHLAAVTAYMKALDGIGYTVNPVGVNEGDKVQTIAGWVLGETSNEQPCVYLYASHPGLQFRVSTIYQERIEDLPFAVNINADRWIGAAPTREMAEKQSRFNEVAEFDIVLIPHEHKKKDNGDPLMIFGRLRQPNAPKAKQDAGSGVTETAPKAVDTAQRNRFHSIGTSLYGDKWDDNRHRLVKLITKGNATSSNDLTPAQMQRFIAGMKKKIAAGAQPPQETPADAELLEAQAANEDSIVND